MTLIQRALDRPRTIRVRRWMFQIHLWAGVICALYAVVIGLTGSVLVFYPQLRDWQDHPLVHVNGTGTRIDADGALEAVKLAHPGVHVMSLRLPASTGDTFQVSTGHMGGGTQFFVDPYSGTILAERAAPRDLLYWLQQLHFNLLGGKTGRIVNGVGGLALLMLTVTGLVVWWPGRAHWRRAMTVKWSSRWKRVNYDLHSALGFFGVAFLLLISVTGAYYAWPRQTQSLLARISPLPQRAPAPKIRNRRSTPDHLSVMSMIRLAKLELPGTWASVVAFPHRPLEPVRLTMMRGGPREYQNLSAVYLDPQTGEVLRVDDASRRSTGDAVVAWIPALHFGSFAGTGGQMAWGLLGLLPALLGVTGTLMWWNRVASKWWRRWRDRDDALRRDVTGVAGAGRGKQRREVTA